MLCSVVEFYVFSYEKLIYMDFSSVVGLGFFLVLVYDFFFFKIGLLSADYSTLNANKRILSLV